MRLLDQLRLNGPLTYKHVSSDQSILDRIASAQLRYVLDRDASSACGELIRTSAGLFEPESEIFRMPAREFWFEAFQESAQETGAPGPRTGVLVECSEDGRSGMLDHFRESTGGRVLQLPLRTEFNLDSPLASEGTAFQFGHGSIPHLQRLFRHTVIRPEPEVLSSLSDQDKVALFRRELAEATWFDLPLLLAFIAMLNSPGVVTAAASDLSRLNRARARRSQPRLMEHVEIRLVLGAGKRESTSGVENGSRTTPRLHHVRGHFMHRAGKAIWRSPHLRGDIGRAALSRIVKVTSPKSQNGRTR